MRTVHVSAAGSGTNLYRSAAADGWRKVAAMETASIAAFAHLANELLALGAPPRLLTGALRAAQEEVEHARLCYGLAASLDGRSLGPAHFPEALKPRDTRLTPERFAVECLIEGCLGEGVSAWVAAELALTATDERTREVLRKISVEELSHAELGWNIVDWCSANHLLDRALRRALERFTFAPVKPSEPDLTHWGLSTSALWREGQQRVFAEMCNRLAARPSGLITA